MVVAGGHSLLVLFSGSAHATTALNDTDVDLAPSPMTIAILFWKGIQADPIFHFFCCSAFFVRAISPLWLMRNSVSCNLWCVVLRFPLCPHSRKSRWIATTVNVPCLC